MREHSVDSQSWKQSKVQSANFTIRDRVQPLPDELLSSWLCRLSYSHMPILQTFTHRIWPGKQIWTRDIDVLAPDYLLNDLSDLCSISKKEAQKTTMKSYTGIVYEEVSGKSRTSHILSVGIYHRLRTRPGLQWCPECLATDSIPYWRKVWRLDFITACLRHGIILADRCSVCGIPAMPHREKQPLCRACGTWYAEHPRQVANSVVLQLQQQIESVLTLENGTPFGLATDFAHPLVFFSYIKLLQRMLVTNPRSDKLMHSIDNHTGLNSLLIPRSHVAQFEDLGVNARHAVMLRVAHLLTGWPWMFIGYCQEAEFYWSWITKDLVLEAIPSKIVWLAQEFCAGTPVQASINHRTSVSTLERASRSPLNTIL